LVEHNHLGYFYEKLKSFGFSLSCPSFTWAALMIENFLLCPPVLFGNFQSPRFFLCLSHLPPIRGVIIVKVISKKRYQAQKGTAKDIFQPCERIIKDGLSSSQMYALRICKPCFHASMQSCFSLFIQLKLSFWSHFMVFFFRFFLSFLSFFLRFSRCMVTFLRNHLNFQNSFVSDKHQHDFCFCTKL